jgi:hypothetical protein
MCWNPNGLQAFLVVMIKLRVNDSVSQLIQVADQLFSLLTDHSVNTFTLPLLPLYFRSGMRPSPMILRSQRGTLNQSQMIDEYILLAEWWLVGEICSARKSDPALLYQISRALPWYWNQRLRGGKGATNRVRYVTAHVTRLVMSVKSRQLIS